MIHPIAFAVLILRFAAAPAVQDNTGQTQTAADPSSPRELIADPHFQRGCILWGPQPGRHVVYGRIPGVGGPGDPVWGVAQWNSREKLSPDSGRTLPSGGLRYANAAKAVTFGPPGSDDADVALAVLGGAEYGDRVREKGEPWVHLLLEQRFEDPPTLTALNRAHFHIEARLKAFRKLDRPGYSPDLHAAQNQVFFTISNTNRASTGFGKLLWFGVPIFDDRARIPPGHQAQDTATGDDSGMFIYTMPASEFTSNSLHDQEWITLDKDLLPAIVSGMETTWKSGYLNESHSLSDYKITRMNIGWEVPGTFDVEVQYRNLSLKVTAHGP